MACPPMTPACWSPSGRVADSSRPSPRATARDGKAAANWVINELLRPPQQGRQGHRRPRRSRPRSSARIVDLIGEGTISGKIAKDLFEIVWSEGGDPRELVEARGLKQVTDTGAIEAAVDAIIAANPDKVAQAKAKPTLIGWFVGQVMKSTGGKANPQAVNELLQPQARDLSLNFPVVGLTRKADLRVIDLYSRAEPARRRSGHGNLRRLFE